MITYLIPVFDEEENLKRIESEFIPVINKISRRYEIIIVDDGSTDNSRLIEKELKKRYKEIRVVKHQSNEGLGSAIKTGIMGAKGELILTLDADFTFHPSEIPKLIETYRKTNADCVIGSHFLKGGKINKVANYRFVLSRTVNKMYSFLFNKKIKTVSSIFRLYKSEAVKNMKLSSTGFDINAEILFRLIKDKKKIVEVPTTLTNRIYGESKLNVVKEIKNHVVLLIRILLWKIKCNSK